MYRIMDLNNKLFCYSDQGLNCGPFNDRTTFNSLSTKLVCNSDPTVIKKFSPWCALSPCEYSRLLSQRILCCTVRRGTVFGPHEPWPCASLCSAWWTPPCHRCRTLKHPTCASGRGRRPCARFSSRPKGTAPRSSCTRKCSSEQKNQF